MGQPSMTIDDVREIIGNVVLDGSKFHVGHFDGSQVMYLQHLFWRRDRETGKAGWGRGRKWHVSAYSTESEIVLTCLKAAITNAEHEVREGFTYQGQPLFHPHPDVNALLTVADKEERRA